MNRKLKNEREGATATTEVRTCLQFSGENSRGKHVRVLGAKLKFETNLLGALALSYPRPTFSEKPATSPSDGGFRPTFENLLAMQFKRGRGRGGAWPGMH